MTLIWSLCWSANTPVCTKKAKAIHNAIFARILLTISGNLLMLLIIYCLTIVSSYLLLKARLNFAQRPILASQSTKKSTPRRAFLTDVSLTSDREHHLPLSGSEYFQQGLERLVALLQSLYSPQWKPRSSLAYLRYQCPLERYQTTSLQAHWPQG